MTESATVLRLPADRTRPADLVRDVHRHLKSRPWARIEVRFSTQAASSFPIEVVRDKLATLVKESGLECPVSVRRIESPLDDALGQHIVRLVPSTPRASEAGAPRPAWLAWLLRHVPVFARLCSVAVSANESTDAAEPKRGAAPTAAALSQRQATEKLRLALKAAVADEVPALAKVPVRRVLVTVRRDDLDAVLRPLLADDAPRAAEWLSQQLVETHHFVAAEGLQLDYRHEPQVKGEGTCAAGGGDLQVYLLREVPAESGAPAKATEPVPQAPVLLDPRPMPVVAAAPQATYETALPSETAVSPVDLPTAMPELEPALRVRVLGTTQGPYDRPFELRFQHLPARFDRAALVDAGFGQAHGEALSVVSQSCPLWVDRSPEGGLRVQAGLRRAAGASDSHSGRAMYYRDDTRAPIVGTVELRTHSEVLIVNDPHTLVDPRSGAKLHPLVIELKLSEE